LVYPALYSAHRMKERLYISLLIYFQLFFVNESYAQHIPDSLQYGLPAFELIADKWNVDLYSTTSIDSTSVILKLHNRVSQGIRQAGNNYIRSYGPGRLTGYSIEGSTSGQSLILWEGIPLQNPLNAYTDLSLFEYASFDQLSQSSNSDFTALGNGSMVPALKFTTARPKAKKSLYAAVELGSFSSSLFKVQFEQISNKWVSKTTIGNQSDRSDFSYTDLNGKTRKMSHAENQSINVQHNQWIAHKKDQYSSLHLWYHNSQKNLPRPYASVPSKQKQEDEFLNLSFKNQSLLGKDTKLNSFVFYQINSNYYEDIDAQLSNDNRFQNIQIQSALKIRSNLELGTKSQFVQGRSENYETVKGHFVQAFFGSFSDNTLLQKTSLSLGSRLELSNRFDPKAGGHLNIERSLNKANKLVLNSERAFRYPTLNDLHWSPGGNEALQTEESLGLRFKYYFKRGLSSFRINTFSRHTNNMIIWIPSATFWSPENIQRVWARGVELNGQHIKIFKQFNSGLTIKSAFTKATNLEQINPLDNSIDKQIIYTPLYTGFYAAFVSWKNNQITLNQEFQSKQFTNRDNSQYLDGFSILNVRLSKQISRDKSIWNIGINLNNILGQDYQLSLGWPMPRQNFQIQISYKTLSE